MLPHLVHLGLRSTSAQSEIPRFARNDIRPGTAHHVNHNSGLFPFQELPDLFEVFAQNLLFPGTAKNVGRVNCGECFRSGEIVELAVYFSDAFLNPQNSPDRGRPEATNQTGLHGLELPEKER